MSTLRVLDERSGERCGHGPGEPPGESLRTLIGRLLVDATRADIALARVRLAALDLTAPEVRSGARCRVLLGALDASVLLDAANDASSGTPNETAVVRPGLRHLAEWLASDRLEVRSAGIGAWKPDFSVYEDRAGTSTSLVGAHYFGSPQLAVGPSVTVVTTDASAARLLRGRFDELWGRAHDVAPAILDVVRRSQPGGADGGHEAFRP